ncbi:MAG: hypothetical protein ACOC05_10110 [Oceanicaulis sp.]
MPRSMFIRRLLAGLAALVCLAAWAVVGASVLLDWERSTTIVVLVVALLATEALFWICAGLLGWKAFENRAKIWRRLTGRGAA